MRAEGLRQQFLAAARALGGAHARTFAAKGRELELALAAGDLATLRLLPRMLRKRAEIRRLSRLSPAEIRRLLLAHRLSLSEVA